MKTLLCGAIAALCLTSNPVLAQHAVGHVGAGHGYGGWHGGYGGWRGGDGYGWRGGWGWRGGGYWGPWGWGGLGLGLYFASLPYYYTTYWWGGVPYYYADNTYYRWNAGVGQYETVAPPAEAGAAGAEPAAAGQSAALIAYPKNGQTEEQQGKDKFECHRWAVSQTGFDPTQAGGGAAGGRRSDYTRAQAACLEGRGYSVK
jgi:hypothetical protein